MNYERPLQEIIIQQIKIIDKTLSGLLTGTNINMADDTQTQSVIKATSHSLQTASAFPVRSDSYAQPPNSSQLTMKVPMQVQKEDPLGNKLWLANGDPQMTTVYVEEPVQTATVQYTQVPQQNSGQQPAQTDNPQQGPSNGSGQDLNPGTQGAGRGRGNGRGGRGRGRGNNNRTSNQNNNQNGDITQNGNQNSAANQNTNGNQGAKGAYIRI